MADEAPQNDLQKEVDRLKAENRKLASDLAGAQEDLKEVRHEARDRRHENKTLAEQLAALTRERDDFQAKAEADPEGLRKQLEEAGSKLRDVNHRIAFARVAQALKVSDPVKVRDLYGLSGYKAETDEPDEAKLTESIQAALKGRPWLLDTTAPGGAPNPPGGASGTAATQAGGKPAPGGDRGQSVTTTSSSAAPGRIPGRL